MSECHKPWKQLQLLCQMPCGEIETTAATVVSIRNIVELMGGNKGDLGAKPPIHLPNVVLSLFDIIKEGL